MLLGDASNNKNNNIKMINCYSFKIFMTRLFETCKKECRLN